MCSSGVARLAALQDAQLAPRPVMTRWQQGVFERRRLLRAPQAIFIMPTVFPVSTMTLNYTPGQRPLFDPAPCPPCPYPCRRSSCACILCRPFIPSGEYHKTWLLMPVPLDACASCGGSGALRRAHHFLHALCGRQELVQVRARRCLCPHPLGVSAPAACALLRARSCSCRVTRMQCPTGKTQLLMADTGELCCRGERHTVPDYTVSSPLFFARPEPHVGLHGM